MFTKQDSFLKFASTCSILFLTAACAAPPPVPIVADMYFDKYSAAQSANNGVDFCELQVEDFTPELVAQIRANPNYDRNLAVWLEECPELALAFADFGTASINGTAAASPLGGEADTGGFAGNIGNGPGGGTVGGGDTGGGDTGTGTGGGDTGGGDTGGGDTGGGDTGDTGDGDTGTGDTGDGDTGGGDGKGGDGKGGDGDTGDGDTGGDGCACDAPADSGTSFG